MLVKEGAIEILRTKTAGQDFFVILVDSCEFETVIRIIARAEAQFKRSTNVSGVCPQVTVVVIDRDNKGRKKIGRTHVSAAKLTRLLKNDGRLPARPVYPNGCSGPKKPIVREGYSFITPAAKGDLDLRPDTGIDDPFEEKGRKK